MLSRSFVASLDRPLEAFKDCDQARRRRDIIATFALGLNPAAKLIRIKPRKHGRRRWVQIRKSLRAIYKDSDSYIDVSRRRR